MTRTPFWPTYLSLAALLASPAHAHAATVPDTATTPAVHHHLHHKTTTTETVKRSGGTTTVTKTVTKTVHGKTVHKTVTEVTTHKPKTAHPAPPPAAPLPRHHKHPRPAPPIVVAPKLAPPVAVAPPPTPAKPVPPPPDPNKGSVTGLPIPRFAALRSDRVNMRTGPGTRYPIDWVYERRDLPVQIEREFEVWRLISEPDGTKGWVHLATLTGRRSFLITGDQPQTLHADANDTSAAVAILKPGVVGHLISCAPASDWCSVEVKTYHGYLNRTSFWGTLPGEGIGQ